MKYLKKFETQAAYDAAKDGLILPNVSLIDADGHVEYISAVEPTETRVVAKFNVIDTTNPTKIACDVSYQPTGGPPQTVNINDNISAIEVDGIQLETVSSGYTFSTTGEHTVKYTLVDPTSVKDGSFADCVNMTSVDIPNNVINIYAGAFQSCSGLTSVVIPNSVTSIDYSAFANCSGLTSVVIPNSVTNIYGFAFCNCYSLISVTVESTTPPSLLGYAIFSNNATGRKIYVSSESVDAYKAASGWSDYASDIEVIQ